MNKERKDYTTDLAVLLDQGRDMFEKYKDRPGFGIVLSVSDDKIEGLYINSQTVGGLKNSFEAIKNTTAFRKYRWLTKKINVAAALD